MKNPEPLLPNSFYHIYNRGINSCNLFESEENYQYFLMLYEKYIEPVANTYAWVLMPNHFHFLIKTSSAGRNEKPMHQYFSNLFNAYTKAFNKFHERYGALFERPFKRKLIDNSAYYQQLVVYIHQNPVHHSFCEHPIEYGWSSYLTCLSDKATKLKRDSVLGWFGNKQVFEKNHQLKMNTEEINCILNL